MGLFNSIFSNLDFPSSGKVRKNTEIQIKWQHPKARGIHAYRVGDVLEDIEDEYNNTWIRTDFICNIMFKIQQGMEGNGVYKNRGSEQTHYFCENRKR